MVTVRNYQEADFPQLAKIYQSAFAEPPWNESWSIKEIRADLDFALSRKEPIVLVAEEEKLIGFSWGIDCP